MAGKKKSVVKIQDLADAITGELSEYEKAFLVDMRKVLRETAEDTAEVVSTAWKTSEAPSAQASKYGDEFIVVEKDKAGKPTMYVSNARPWLAHLLENGHALMRGGRKVGEARGFPHFEAGYNYAVREIGSRIRKAIEEAKVK